MIRPARPDDLDALIEVGRRAWLSAFAQTAPFGLIARWASSDVTVEHYTRYWPDMHVLEEESRILGLVQPARDEINGLWVHPAYQGTGAGTALLRGGERLIREAGHTTAWLHCSVMNPRALGFYLHRGYVETGRDKGMHPWGFPYENIRLERALGR